MLKDSIAAFGQHLWERHPGKCVCGTAGILLGICILIFGFWNMLFIFFMGVVGLFVGMNVDREGNTWQNIKDCIPRDIHRLR